MANVLVGNLPTYTGNTTGVYLVMNDSGNTTTYKVLNSNLGVPSWTSAGTIQSVGWSATTTSPTVGTTLKNNISYRQIGSKQWEIAMAFDKLAGQGASAGNGDYLFKLPNSLQFDTTVPWQSQYQGGIGINDTSLTKFTIPSGGGNIGDGAGSSATTFVPVVWDSSNFRILVHIPGSSITCMGSNLFPVTSSIGFTLYFQVTSL